MSNAAAAQTAAWRLRRANRSRFFTSQATPWSAGLVVTAGDIVSVGQLAWQAQNAGTTAGVEPNNSEGAAFTDGGGVQWLHLPLLLVMPSPVA
jgi:hypothetical protein